MADENLHMECSECGGTMLLDEQQIMLVCPYCGNREPMDEVTASRLNAKDAKEAAKEKRAAQQHKAQQRSNAGKGIKKAFLAVVGVIVGLGILGGVMSAIEDAEWEAEQANRLKTPYTWPTSGIGSMLPQPVATTGYIDPYAGSGFEIDVPCESENDCALYIERVKEAGFTVDASTSGSRYEAYNADGYQVKIYYYTYQKPAYMEIGIEPPLEAKLITWPTIGVGAKVPLPPSTMGVIENASEKDFRAKLVNVSREAFATYCESCVKAGFDKNYSIYDDRFWGENSVGDRLRVEYIGFDKIEISIYTKDN